MNVLSKKIVAATAVSFMVGSSGFAQGLGNISGEIGLTAGLGSVSEIDSSPDKESAAFGVLDGSVDFKFGGRYALIIDGNYRYDDFNDDFSSTEDPQSEYTVGAHILRDFGQNSSAGVFLGYGDTLPQDGDMDDAYDVLFYGVEAQTNLAENVKVYAQLGVGDKVRDGQDDEEGFVDGTIVRFGMTYSYSEITSFNADFEMARSDQYIDGDDAGRFYGITFSGKTRLSSTAPIFANYFVRYDYLNSTTESDSLDELQVGVGVRYAFGGGSNSVGLPRMPTRASAWTEWMD